ncbi:FAD-binding protein [Ructibacterium gallinarum]|uniref:Electron transfer flavoprotein alpha/beta-subunit N-terminal domain-containing protein n=1 Tax=Ructibacterium gallinarum TaxID=2779355 RepID=A0A9D5M244_9FIRM|nr:FAD-binding protein [Ructibacterium gallinarum]MBE5040731.1 hypothetical protein [Ructibacterium gallinarum]
MKILVCVKIIQGEINPFDASALECALTLSEDVTILSMGAEHTKETVSALTRLGAKAILITDKLYAGSDTLATANVLAAAIKKLPFDLILCGRQSIDGSTAQVGVMLSQMIGCSLLTGALSVTAEKDAVTVRTREGQVRSALPALITMEKEYRLRFPSIFSRTQEVILWDNTVLGCSPDHCGLRGSATRVLQTFESERGKRNCQFVSMDNLFPLIEQLKKEMKRTGRVWEEKEQSSQRLPCVWAVGEDVFPYAKAIADQVVRIPKEPVEKILQRAAAEKPEVILWNSDAWGRINASIAAAALQTGLCADCTQLETDGRKLYIYRPALGGRVTAKIECLTRPQMATVRTKSDSADIIVAGGRGAASEIDKLQDFAKKIGAQLAASRGLVDMDQMPYSAQIGLTGKTVSPKIYIAVGISGAVQHVCAIEGAQSIIAVNPDPNAPIFDYADYGIIEKF